MTIQVQVGRYDSAYRTRYSFEDTQENRAWFHYNALNIHNGYKKRIIGSDGKVWARYLSGRR